MTIKDTPEYQHANEVISNHSIGITIETRTVNSSSAVPIEEAFEKLNDFQAFTPEIVESLRALARVVEKYTDGKGTVRVSRTEWMGAKEPGLTYDE